MFIQDVILPCAELGYKEADKLFFSESPKKIAKAKSLCGQCPAITKCLEYALDQEIEFGIFGGTTPQERKAML